MPCPQDSVSRSIRRAVSREANAIKHQGFGRSSATRHASRSSTAIAPGGRKGKGTRPGAGAVQVISTWQLLASVSGALRGEVTGTGSKSRADAGNRDTAAPAGASIVIEGASLYSRVAVESGCQAGRRMQAADRRSASLGSSGKLSHNSTHNGFRPRSRAFTSVERRQVPSRLRA